MTSSAFTRFAPDLLKVYHRDKTAFWKAVMAPFLVNQTSLLAWFGHLRTDVELLAVFRGLDDEARALLTAFGAPLELDIPAWKSSRTQYLKDAYPVFAFLAVWMDEVGLKDLIDRFDEILRAGVYAVAGYGILDANVDSNAPSPVEILAAQALIAEYETLALRIFGVSDTNVEILQKMRRLFLDAEIREKATRWRTSPYSLNDPSALGAKGANSVTPFMLCLERLGRSAQIDDYWRVFLLFGAAIQMIDDWTDLEGDLASGHYSYVTLGLNEALQVKDPHEAAQRLRADKDWVRRTYATSQEMIAESRAILARLNETLLVKLVDATEARVDAYFKKELGVG